MGRTTKNIHWIWMFMIFMWGTTVYLACQLNGYQEEVNSFIEARKNLEIQSAKILLQSNIVGRKLTNVNEKLKNIEEYLYLGFEDTCAATFKDR